MTNAQSRITDTAQTAAESVADAVGTFLSNDKVGAAIDKADAVYRKNPLVSKIALAAAAAVVVGLLVRSARR